MYVSSEVRRRELPETSSDPSLYAAAASGSSFMAILSEMSSPAPESCDPSASEESAEVSTATETSSTEATDETNETGTTAESEKVSEQASTTETAETPSEVSASAGTEDVQVPAVETSTTEAVVPGDTVVGGNNPATTATATVTEPKLVTQTGQADEPTATEPVDVEGAPDRPESKPAAHLEGAVPAAETIVSTTDPVSPTPVENFPKTLNALIAEGALRKDEGRADEIDALEPEKLERPDPMPDASIDPPAAEVPDSLPQPLAAAMESGGVRPQSAGLPRLPMVNLPGELAQQIHMMQQEGNRTMRLTLVPENLGELRVEIQGSGDTMRVKLVTANPAVRDALESQMGALKDALQKQGLALDNATVDSGSTRRETTPDQNQRTSPTPYRATARTLVLSGTNAPPPAPIALGASALNILA